jgi:hypothetical protein
MVIRERRAYEREGERKKEREREEETGVVEQHLGQAVGGPAQDK